MNEEKQQNRQHEYWLYLGNTVDKTDKLCTEFETVEYKDETYHRTGTTRIFSLKNQYIVGGIYSVEVTTDENGKFSMFTNTLKFVLPHPDKDLTETLRLKQKVFLAEKRARDYEKKLKNTRYEFPVYVADLKKHYQSLDMWQRRIFIQMLADELSKK